MDKNRREAAKNLGVKKFIYIWEQKNHTDEKDFRFRVMGLCKWIFGFAMLLIRS